MNGIDIVRKKGSSCVTIKIQSIKEDFPQTGITNGVENDKGGFPDVGFGGSRL